jgi:hypothetical protein
MSTYQFNVSVGNDGVYPIVDIAHAPNTPCEVIVQNLNGNGIAAYIGNSHMWEQETYGIKLLDGMSLSLTLGAYDELYAFADDWTTLYVLKTSGNRK